MRAELIVYEMREMKKRLNIAEETDIPKLQKSITRFAPPIWDATHPPSHLVTECLASPLSIFVRQVETSLCLRNIETSYE